MRLSQFLASELIKAQADTQRLRAEAEHTVQKLTAVKQEWAQTREVALQALQPYNLLLQKLSRLQQRAEQERLEEARSNRLANLKKKIRHG